MLITVLHTNISNQANAKYAIQATKLTAMVSAVCVPTTVRNAQSRELARLPTPLATFATMTMPLLMSTTLGTSSLSRESVTLLFLFNARILSTQTLLLATVLTVLKISKDVLSVTSRGVSNARQNTILRMMVLVSRQTVSSLKPLFMVGVPTALTSSRTAADVRPSKDPLFVQPVRTTLDSQSAATWTPVAARVSSTLNRTTQASQSVLFVLTRLMTV